MIVPIDQVIADSRCQSRTGIDLGLVHDYAEAIKSGADMPPLSVIDSGDGLYLYDGFHRLEAYRQAGVKTVPVAAEPGDIWDAIERSCAVNAVHGKRRTPEDTKNAVSKILEVMEHKGKRWTFVDIADKCAITDRRVSQIIKDDPSLSSKYFDDSKPATVTRNGSTYEMNTANIGKYRAPKSDLEGLDFDDEDVDEETGEIHSPAPSHPLPPIQKQQPRGQLDTLEFMDYGADDLELTYKSIAYAIIHDYGNTAALRVAAFIKEGTR